MKKKIGNNLSLKILSLAIAILVWLLVVNINNPISTKSFIVSDVELLNEAYIDADGKMCMQDEEQVPIRVTIKAQRKILDRISLNDIRAVADLQQAVSLKTDPVMVPITVSCGRISADNIEVSPQNMSLHLEDKDTQEFVVNVNTNNTKPDRGYEIGALTSNPEKIKITGPVSLINKIDKVNASIDVDGAMEDVTQETDVKIIDKNGEEFTDTDMGYLNVSKVYVTAKLWKVQSNVRISAEYSGTPAAGYQVESIMTTPNVISIAGSEDALASLKEQNNTIWLPGSVADISDRNSDFEEKINISDYLPDGLKLTSDSSEDVFVRVNILPEGSNVCEVPTKNIIVNDSPEGMQVSFDTAKIEIRVKKTSDDLADLTEGDIKASIDLKGMSEGSYEVPVSIEIPKGYELVDEVTTGVVSLINKIDKVNASIDVDGAMEDVTQETDVKIIDKNGEEFTDTDMGYLNVSKVYVTAKLWKVQSNVRISAEYSGTPAAGYQVESIMTTPNVISIAGSEDALASLKEQNNTIWLPGSVADISDRNSDFEEKINISDYLPDGLKLTSDSSEDVFVRVNILPEGSNVCEVPTKNIIVNDSPEGMQVSFDTAKIEIRVKKTSDDLADLTEGDIKASIDLKGMSEGSYEVPVSIEIPKGYELVDEVTTGVEISKISTADESN